MATIDFKDREDLERWLKSRPREDAIVLAARAALRVAPLLSWPGIERTHLTPHKWGVSILLPCLRGILSCWLAVKVPSQGDEKRTHATESAFAAAANASIVFSSPLTAAARLAAVLPSEETPTAFAFTASDAALRAAYGSEEAAVFFGVFLGNTRDYAASTFWKIITHDARALAGADGVAQLSPTQLASAPLWPRVKGSEDVPPWPRGEWPEGKPFWAGRAVIKFDTYLDALQREHPDEHWEVWQAWYSARQNGGNAFGLDDAAAERVETGIVLLPDEVWKAGPKAVNTAIHDLIQKERAGEAADAAAGERQENNNARPPAPPQPSRKKRADTSKTASTQATGRATTKKVRPKTPIGKAMVARAGDLEMIAPAVLVLIDKHISELRDQRPNSDEANAARDKEIATLVALRAQLVDAVEAAVDLQNGRIAEKEAVEKAISFRDGMAHWWTHHHMEICDLAARGAIFAAGTGLCSWMGVSTMIGGITFGALVAHDKLAAVLKSLRGVKLFGGGTP